MTDKYKDYSVEDLKKIISIKDRQIKTFGLLVDNLAEQIKLYKASEQKVIQFIERIK